MDAIEFIKERNRMHRDYQWNKNGIYPICPNCGAKIQRIE